MNSLRESIWHFEHAVETRADRDFAWRFWSDVSNWAVVDPAIEWARIDGPFEAGARGETKPVGQEITPWRLAEVEEGRQAVVEIAVPGATARFAWRFEDRPGGGARMIQRVDIGGENAEIYVDAMKPLETGMPVGMQKLAAAIDRAATEPGATK